MDENEIEMMSLSDNNGDSTAKKKVFKNKGS